MKCRCGGEIKKRTPDRWPSYFAICNKCGKHYTFMEYRELQAEKLIEAAKKGMFE